MSAPSNQTALFTPKSVMGVAIGLLLIALSIRLGLVGSAIDWIHQAYHEETETIITQREVLEPTQGHPASSADEETFVVVETPPVLLGGLQELQQRIHYPEIALKAGINGRVFLQFIVEKDGTPSNIIVARGIGGGCDQEAVRALSEVRFSPGQQRGTAVRVKMSLPIVFRIN